VLWVHLAFPNKIFRYYKLFFIIRVWWTLVEYIIREKSDTYNMLINWITLIHHSPQSRKLDKIGNRKSKKQERCVSHFEWMNRWKGKSRESLLSIGIKGGCIWIKREHSRTGHKKKEMAMNRHQLRETGVNVMSGFLLFAFIMKCLNGYEKSLKLGLGQTLKSS